MNIGHNLIIGIFGMTLLTSGYGMSNSELSSPPPIVGSIMFLMGILLLISIPIIMILSHITNKDSRYEGLYYRNLNYSNQEDNQPSGSFSKSTGRFEV